MRATLFHYTVKGFMLTGLIYLMGTYQTTQAGESTPHRAVKGDPVMHEMQTGIIAEPYNTIALSEFVQCWKIPAGSANDKAPKVSVDVALRPDGSLIDAALAPEQRGQYGSDTAFRAAADSAVRAVYKCNPIKHLPTEKYNSWKEMRLNFDPSMQLR